MGQKLQHKGTKDQRDKACGVEEVFSSLQTFVPLFLCSFVPLFLCPFDPLC